MYEEERGKAMKNKIAYWLMQVSIFLLRGAGWAAIGIVVGFIVSFFFRPVGRVDIFAFTETMLGVVITGLSVVGAFIIALQWSNLDKRMHEFDIKVKETTDIFSQQAKTIKQLATETDAYVESTIDVYTRGYKENMEYLDGLLQENRKTAVDINSKVDEYKTFYEEKAKKFEETAREIDEKQKKFGKIVKDYGALMNRVEKFFAQQTGEHPDIEEPVASDD
jgi:flagellar motor component MotA